MNLKEKFKSIYPGAFFLEPTLTPELIHYLRQRNWITEEEKLISLHKPGEGNMNRVVRVVTNQRTFILKQARPWVQKYPQIAAPIERIEVEARFYEWISGDDHLSAFTPAWLGFDPENFILALEDLGKRADFTFLYQRDQCLSAREVQSLIKFISRLHQIKGQAGKEKFPSNQALKALNHQHIFYFPYSEENGLNLNSIQEGLQDLSLAYKKNAVLKKKIRDLGDLYLRIGPRLIHGDYYPGSWLKVPSGVKVIDPEFSYFGQPEFDLGVMVAHFRMARFEETFIKDALDQYESVDSIDYPLVSAFAGVEVLRRLLGLAQLPLSLSLEEKCVLLEEAAAAIRKN